MQKKSWVKVMVMAADLALVSWLTWHTMVPEHQKAEIRMRVAQELRNKSLRLAKAAARNGMALELAAGTTHAGKAWYETARMVMIHGYERAEESLVPGRGQMAHLLLGRLRAAGLRAVQDTVPRPFTVSVLRGPTEQAPVVRVLHRASPPVFPPLARRQRKAPRRVQKGRRMTDEENIPPLRDLLMIRMTWKGGLQGKTHPYLHQHDVVPEPGWPVGRKGRMLARLWQQLAKPTSDGMLINDGDCVIDSHDMIAMVWAAGNERDAVHTAPVRLWPSCTGLPDWVWAHRHEVDSDIDLDVIMKDWQTDVDDPQLFSFNFTFIPRRLIEACIERGMEDWIFPHVDENMWMTARDEGIPVRVVRNGCHPRHMNY
jgi:hypothetical protein